MLHPNPYSEASKRVRYNVEAYALEIQVSENSGYWYQIGLERCQTYEKLIKWIMHLAAKPWFDIFIMQALASEWEDATGLPVEGGL